MAYVYRVQCAVRPDLADQWEAFFREKHLDDILNTGHFTGYSFRRALEPAEDGYLIFVSEYYYVSKANFSAYLNLSAAEMKRDVQEHFPEGFRASRSHSEIIMDKP
ncbi:MAG: DUF4286 family protein [Bacteroidota bacterium]